MKRHPPVAISSSTGRKAKNPDRATPSFSPPPTGTNWQISRVRASARQTRRVTGADPSQYPIPAPTSTPTIVPLIRFQPAVIDCPVVSPSATA